VFESRTFYKADRSGKLIGNKGSRPSCSRTWRWMAPWSGAWISSSGRGTRYRSLWDSCS